MKIRDMLEFIEIRKDRYGFGNWKVTLQLKDLDDAQAKTYLDRDNKLFELHVSKELFSEPKDKIINVLLHEIIHARILLFNIDKHLMTAEINRNLEEDLANDLTKGFEFNDA